MLFNSLIFVAFAIVYFVVSKFIGKRVKARLFWLTGMSFFFYGWWDWRFLFLIIFSGLIDYYAALAMVRWEKHRKLLLFLSMAGNIGSLSVFKYSGFIAQNIDMLFGLTGAFSLADNIPPFFLVTPVGISFYTFQSMSYTLDVYHRKFTPTKDVIHFFAFLSMFPQLVAGPIIRAKEMLPQLLVVKKVESDEKWAGFRYVVKGYFMKMVIADNLAPLVVSAFSAPQPSSSSAYWWGAIIAFALQIYCDFAGYSNIARGLARWMGYDFPDNFNHPYISVSLREFWTRWHISLSTWFRDYLYIPLGGNRKGKWRSHLNMAVTMVISGLWHGAAWTYVTWGALHAFFLSLERMTGWNALSSKNNVLRLVAWFLTTIQVLVAWVFFRAESMEQAWQIIKTMFSFTGKFDLGWGLNGWVFVTIMIISEIVEASKLKEKISMKPALAAWVEMAFYALMITAIVFFRGSGSEFIYFQF